MSCFIVSQETTATLADFVSSLCNMGYNFFGFEAPEDLQNALRECRDRYGYMNAEPVYFALRELNVSAYIARYKQYKYPWAPDVYEPCTLHRPAEYDEGFYKVQNWHYEILKKLDCFLYQCTEGSIPETPLYNGLQDLKVCLLGFIARNNPIYTACKWG